MFVPGNADAIVLRSGLTCRTRLDAFLSADDCLNSQRGQILERNSSRSRAPACSTSTTGSSCRSSIARVEVTFDVLNLLNLIDEDKGLTTRRRLQPVYDAGQRGIDPATGKPIYRAGFTGSVTPAPVHDRATLRSRWQAKLGLRVSF